MMELSLYLKLVLVKMGVLLLMQFLMVEAIGGKYFFLDTESKSLLSDSLNNVKFSSLSWKINEGIYYSSYDAPEGSELSSLNNNHKLYFHKLGTTQEKDQIIFGNKAETKKKICFILCDGGSKNLNHICRKFHIWK